MATVFDNQRYWGTEYGWPTHGDEWSAPWGGVAAQWYGMVLPRIHRAVPAQTILEIACGHGRWTAFLATLCTRLIAVDCSITCVEACRSRFAGLPHVECYVNDGRSLSMVADESVDFVLSLDSLVHVNPEVMHAYMQGLARILRPTGVAFLHHSNLADCPAALRWIWARPHLWRLASRLRLVDGYLHERDPLVGAGLVRESAAANGLTCAVQEMVQWCHSKASIDCFSTVVRRSGGRNRLFRNGRFGQETNGARRLSEMYGD